MCRRCVWLVISVLAVACFAGLAHGQTVYVNFQTAGAEVPEGYLPDSGAVFGDQGNGWSYGWDRDISADAREKNAAISPDKRWDTLMHLQKGADATWEIALENGVYNLYIVAGDAGYTDQTNCFDIEGVIIEDPDGQAGNWDELTATVTVADGRLTLTTAACASNAKICFIDIVLAQAPESARSPDPEDEAGDVPRDLTVAWEPGTDVIAHDVYLGTNVDDVNTASRSNPMDLLLSQEQSDTSLDVGRLEFDQTYYWRVDEVLSDGSIYHGDVWSFTVEPYTYAVENIVATTDAASEAGLGIENTINGSGLSAEGGHSTASADMWQTVTATTVPFSVQYEFDQTYKLDEMLIWNYNVQFEPVLGFGVKEVTVEYSADGETWTALGDVELAQATATEGYVANNVLDFGGAAVKYVKLTVNSNFSGLPQFGLSEVRFMYIPATARQPEPAVGATDVSVATLLSWRAGREAASHEVSLGTDAENLALVGSADAASYDPGALDLDTMYYWKVDEVNEAEAISLWEGPVWSFTTEAFLVVDDFESYNDVDNVIYETWIDGWVNDTGSQVGYLVEPFAETTIVNSGRQAMPLLYDNINVNTAEAELPLSQNWTESGIKSLSLSVYGDPDNTGQLYLEINGTRVDYTGDITAAAWQTWIVDLSTVGNVSNVNSLVIGVEGSGATGVVYIDDIRLQAWVATEPDSATLVASYQFEGNADDSSGNGLNGTLVDAELVSPGKLGEGMAVQVNDAGYVDLGNPAALDFSTGDWTVTAWYKTGMTGTGDDNKGTVYGKGGDTGGGHRYCLIMSEATEGVMTLVTDDDSTKVVVTSTSVTNDDEWHFVAGQRNGTALNIFIDGVLEATGVCAAGYDLSGTVQHNAYIGAITNHGDSSLYKLFIGLIDDVRVYSTALSEGEILWLASR